MGGIIVFLYHTDDILPPEMNEFPESEFMKFEHSCKNGLTKTRARHSIKMRKIKSPF